MRKLLIPLATALLIACGTEEDPIIPINVEPTITYDIISRADSIKIGSDPYEVDLSVTDEMTGYKVTKEQLVGTGSSYVNDTLITDTVSVIADDLDLVYYPVTEGEHRIDYYVHDQLGLSSIQEVEIIAFENLPPIARLNITDINNASLLINVVASDSYDRDSHFNGEIIEYEYSVLETNVTLNYDVNEVEMFFPQPGTYTIRLRVKDNNDEWSEYAQTTVTL